MSLCFRFQFVSCTRTLIGFVAGILLAPVAYSAAPPHSVVTQLPTGVVPIHYRIQVRPDAANLLFAAEVDIEIGGGNVVSAVITHGSSANLGLKAGGHACAMFKASSVILGVS